MVPADAAALALAVNAPFFFLFCFDDQVTGTLRQMTRAQAHLS